MKGGGGGVQEGVEGVGSERPEAGQPRRIVIVIVIGITPL